MKSINLTDKQYDTLMQTMRKSNRRLAHDIDNRERALPYLRYNGLVAHDESVAKKAEEQLAERKQRLADQQDLMQALEEA